MAGAYPYLFAAIVPICGGGEFDRIEELVKLPVRAFHCDEDPVAPYGHIQDFVEELQEIGNKNVSLTTYNSANHDAWTATYENKEVWDWLFGQQK
jgi:predicted peptidase